PSDGDEVLRLGPFTPEEFAAAYKHYQDRFGLQTPLEQLPDPLRERLQRPLLLRMLAEAYQGRPVTVSARSLTPGIFRRYYAERVHRRPDRLFVDELAEEMLSRRQAALPIDELVGNEHLKADLVSDEPDSAYASLLDSGILSETRGDLFTGDTV